MLRLLLVTDDLDLISQMEILLSREGVDLVVSDVREGLADSVAARPPDAAILDLCLPDGAGWSFLGLLRERLAAASFPILALTGADAAENSVRAFSLGADDVLSRPFDPAELALRALASLASLQDRSAALRGRLEVYPLPELLQSCERAGWSGILRITGDGGSAKIGLQQGKVVAAESGELRGIEALRAALDNTRGELVLNAGEMLQGLEPLIPNVRRLLLDLAWGTSDPEEPELDLSPSPSHGVISPPVVSIFYTRAARIPLRAFLALLPSADSLPVSLAGESVERGERRVTWPGEGGATLVRYQPLALDSVSEIFQRAGEAISIVLWLGPDLTADGVPMPLQLLQAAARQAEQLLLVTEPPDAARVLLSELDGSHRWRGAPDSHEALAQQLWGTPAGSRRPAAARAMGHFAGVVL